MKFQESHFEEYLQTCEKVNLHPNLNKIYNSFPETIDDLKNCIFYGPSGSGKYTQSLMLLKKYSPSNLKYEKKISITLNKNNFFFKISDIHVEIDMNLLGCNSKLLWNEIYSQMLDVAATKPNNTYIIMCKNFQDIHGELLEDFYSYLQTTNYNSIKLIYIIITEQISFIPDNIINICKIINVPKPQKTKISNAFNKKLKCNINDVTNLKNLKVDITNIMNPHHIICDKIISLIINIPDLNFLELRDSLYDIFIYNLNVYECIWYIFSTLINCNNIKNEKISDTLIKTYTFFKYFNNNYRPIYHLENYVLYLIKSVHGF